MTTVYLIRHGTTDNNLNGLFQGSRDIPLGELGILQSQQLAERFKNIPLQAIYTSPLIRAQQTAQILCKNHPHMSPILGNSLRELNGGLLEGHSGEENTSRFPQQMKYLDNQPTLFSAPGGESTRQVYNRMIHAMRGIVDQCPNQQIAVVSHGFTIQTYIGYVKQVPFDQLERYIVGNTSVTCLQYDQNKISLIYMSDMQHLPSNLQFYVADNFLHK